LQQAKFAIVYLHVNYCYNVGVLYKYPVNPVLNFHECTYWSNDKFYLPQNDVGVNVILEVFPQTPIKEATRLVLQQGVEGAIEYLCDRTGRKVSVAGESTKPTGLPTFVADSWPGPSTSATNCYNRKMR